MKQDILLLLAYFFPLICYMHRHIRVAIINGKSDMKKFLLAFVPGVNIIILFASMLTYEELYGGALRTNHLYRTRIESEILQRARLKLLEPNFIVKLMKYSSYNGDNISKLSEFNSQYEYYKNKAQPDATVRRAHKRN